MKKMAFMMGLDKNWSNLWRCWHFFCGY